MTEPNTHDADLGEYEKPTNQMVAELIEDDVIGYPSEYGYDNPTEFMNDVVEILESDSYGIDTGICGKCLEEDIDDPEYDHTMDLTEYSPSDAPVSDEEADRMAEEGLHLYVVELEVSCDTHDEDSIVYDEDIMALPGALDYGEIED